MMTGDVQSAVQLDFVAFGDLGVDSVVRLDHLPDADEKLWVDPAGEFAGGMMGNAAVAAASLGASAAVVALLGSDTRGALVLHELRRRGVDTRHVQTIDSPTFWTLSLTTPSGERALIQFPTLAFGADWARAPEAVKQARWVHTAAEQGDPVRTLLHDAKRLGATTSLDVEFPFVLRTDLPDILSFVDVAFLNSGAAEALGGVEEAARQVRASGAGTALVTMGAEGVYMLQRDGRDRFLPAHKVQVVDTNGAGDAFAGGFAAGILKGFSESDAAELGVFVAGLSTTAMGGYGPELGLRELRKLAKKSGYSWPALL
jgi:ribokinase